MDDDTIRDVQHVREDERKSGFPDGGRGNITHARDPSRRSASGGEPHPKEDKGCRPTNGGERGLAQAVHQIPETRQSVEQNAMPGNFGEELGLAVNGAGSATHPRLDEVARPKGVTESTEDSGDHHVSKRVMAIGGIAIDERGMNEGGQQQRDGVCGKEIALNALVTRNASMKELAVVADVKDEFGETKVSKRSQRWEMELGSFLYCFLLLARNEEEGRLKKNPHRVHFAVGNNNSPMALTLSLRRASVGQAES